MDTTPGQASENNKKSIQLALKDDFSYHLYRSIKIWASFSRSVFALIIPYIVLLFFSDSEIQSSLKSFLFDLQSSLPALLLPKPEEFNAETYLNQISQASIQLDRKVIQVSSVKEQIFPMLVSREIQELDSPPRASVDLICVFDFSHNPSIQKERIWQARSLFKEFLPLMTDQDRLSIVLLGSLWGPILSILTFMNTTTENQKEIISNFGENILKREPLMIKDYVNILEGRKVANQATGVFLISDTRELKFREYTIKEDLGLQDVYTVLTVDLPYPSRLDLFKRGLEVLRNGVAKTQLLIKPEESQLFRGVEIFNLLWTEYINIDISEI